MKTRGTATDKLADVIQTLQLVRKTGLLTVQRDVPGGISEVGTIAFHDGQIINADVGRMRGADAFKKLMMWTRCYFVFEPVSPSSPPLIALPSPRSENNSIEPRNPQELPGESVSVGTVPQRSQYTQGMIPDFQRLGLSRMHRQLFLLNEGRRCVHALTRQIGRHPQELQAILVDLENAGLIRQ